MNPQVLYALAGLAGAVFGGGSIWGAMRSTVKKLVEKVEALEREDKARNERLTALETHLQHMVDDLRAQRLEIHETRKTLQDIQIQLISALNK